MLYQPEYAERLAALANRLGEVAQADEAAFQDILRISAKSGSCVGTVAETNLRKLISCEAWTEAALASIDALAPNWKLCRLIYDGGEWFCSLSSYRNMPDWLDQMIECRHQDLSLSILIAVVEAVRNEEIKQSAQPPRRVRIKTETLVLCEDFF